MNGEERDVRDYIPEEIETLKSSIIKWEQSEELNPDHLRVVRGQDGLPVEVIVVDDDNAAFVVNGEERPFDIGDLIRNSSLSDPIPSLCAAGVLDQGYLVHAYKYIDTELGSKTFIIGEPTGTAPGVVSQNPLKLL